MGSPVGGHLHLSFGAKVREEVSDLYGTPCCKLHTKLQSFVLSSQQPKAVFLVLIFHMKKGSLSDSVPSLDSSR